MKLESGVLLAAIAFYVLTCATAHAVTIDQRFENKATIATDQIELCYVNAGGAPVCTVLQAPCPAMSTCTVKVDLPHGRSILSARVTAPGSAWSPISQPLTKIAVDPVRCIADDVCALDRDRDGTVTGIDFGHFPPAFGQTWAR